MLNRLALHVLVPGLYLLLLGCAANRPAGYAGDGVDRLLGARIRILSYNIRIGRGMDDKTDLRRTAEVIRKLNPDLVALQEVDNKTDRSAGVDEAAELGKLTGMQSFFCKAMDLPGGEYGEAVLSRLPVEATQCHPLPHSRDREPRSALEVCVRLPGTKTELGHSQSQSLRFIGTHLDHLTDPSVRVSQAKALAGIVTADNVMPVVLAGDFNDHPGSEALMSLGGNWLDSTMGDPSMTFPSDKPDIRLDYVFARPANRWRLISARVIDEPVASDHRPVLVVWELLP